MNIRTLNTNITNVKFKNNHVVYETFTKCTIKDYEFNFTYNPTILSGSQGILTPYSSSINGNIVYTNTGSDGILKEEFVEPISGSEFSPYVTTVGLYNDAGELLAVGKMAAPMPLSSNTDVTFLIKWDTQWNPRPYFTPSVTPTPTPTVTPSVTPSISITPSITPTPTVTPSVTPSVDCNLSGFLTIPTSPSPTPSRTPSVTPSLTPSVTPSVSTNPCTGGMTLMNTAPGCGGPGTPITYIQQIRIDGTPNVGSRYEVIVRGNLFYYDVLSPVDNNTIATDLASQIQSAGLFVFGCSTNYTITAYSTFDGTFYYINIVIDRQHSAGAVYYCIAPSEPPPTPPPTGTICYTCDGNFVVDCSECFGNCQAVDCS